MERGRLAPRTPPKAPGAPPEEGAHAMSTELEGCTGQDNLGTGSQEDDGCREGEPSEDTAHYDPKADGKRYPLAPWRTKRDRICEVPAATKAATRRRGPEQSTQLLACTPKASGGRAPITWEVEDEQQTELCD